MIKNSTLKAFIFSTILMGTTATITAGVCTNWFRGTSEKSSSSISSVIDSSSIESSKSEISSEESTSSVEESISSDSSASSLDEESSSITLEETSSSSTNEDPTARISFDSIADWESYYNETFFSSESKYYQDFNQIMTDVENEAHLTEEQFNQKITNDLLACNFIGINFTNSYKDDDIMSINSSGSTDKMYYFAIDDKNLLSFTKQNNEYSRFDLGSVDNGGFITSTSEMLWGFGKMMFTDGAEVTDLYYQTKDFSIANLNGTVIKDSYTYNGTNESKIGFAANLNINFENEKFNFSQAQMDEINSLLTAKNLALSEHQLSHITII